MVTLEELENRLGDGDGKYMIINIICRRARDVNRQRAQMAAFEEEMVDPLGIANEEFESSQVKWEFNSTLSGISEDYRSSAG